MLLQNLYHISYKFIVRNFAVFIALKVVHQSWPELIFNLQLWGQALDVDIAKSPFKLLKVEVTFIFSVKNVKGDFKGLIIDKFRLIAGTSEELLKADLSIIVMI